MEIKFFSKVYQRLLCLHRYSERLVKTPKSEEQWVRKKSKKMIRWALITIAILPIRDKMRGNGIFLNLPFKDWFENFNRGKKTDKIFMELWEVPLAWNMLQELLFPTRKKGRIKNSLPLLKASSEFQVLKTSGVIPSGP